MKITNLGPEHWFVLKYSDLFFEEEDFIPLLNEEDSFSFWKWFFFVTTTEENDDEFHQLGEIQLNL